jgi:hypothetical protein
MFLEGAVAEDEERHALLKPLPYLSCPFLKEWFVDLHTRVPDITHERKICRCGNL